MMSNAPYILFDWALFQQQIPAYADPITYPEATINNWWTIATSYVTNANWGSLTNSSRALAINLMAAHLIYISNLIAAGTVPYLMQNSTIDKVQVGLTPPPLPDQWSWWLSVSPYGQQLLALLQVNSVGGFYIGGSAPRAAFGYQGGSFWGIPGGLGGL